MKKHEAMMIFSIMVGQLARKLPIEKEEIEILNGKKTIYQYKISENSIVIKTEISLALIEDEGIINANLTGIVPWKLDSMSFHKIIGTTEDGKEFEEALNSFFKWENRGGLLT